MSKISWEDLLHHLEMEEVGMGDYSGIIYRNKGRYFGITSLLFITLGLISCEHNINNIVEQEPITTGKHLLTVSATLPEDNISPMSRLILEDDKGGIKTRWEKDCDELILFLEHQGDRYSKVAHIKSLSADRRMADFKIEVPEDWTGNCNIYGMLQKNKLPKSGMLDDWAKAGCEFISENLFAFKTARNQNLFSSELTSNPALWFKDENVEIASGMNNVHVDLQHLGYLIALHIKNGTSEGMPIPDVELYTRKVNEFFPSDGSQSVNFNVRTGKCLSIVNSHHISFSKRTPYLSKKVHEEIPSGNIVTLYHWLPCDVSEVPEFDVRLMIPTTPPVYCACEGQLKKRSVVKGMVYHIYLEYNGGYELESHDKF